MTRLSKMNGSTWMALSVMLIPILLIVMFTADARVWTDTKGRTIEADIVRVDGSDAIVNRGGKETRLPLTLLSDADKQFVAKWQEEQKTTKPSAAATAATKDKPAARPVSPTPASSGAYYNPATLPIFNPYPNVTDRGPWLVKNLGPVGIGINLTRPGMTMQINNVEKGSPAEATGKLEKGQIIESINGKVLEQSDPRVILGDILTEAEAKDGKITLKIEGKGDVTVTIPVMGAYSGTWPVNCPKSDKIVRNLADLLAKEEKPTWGSVIFLLSTGEEKDLAVVRNWMKNVNMVGTMNWDKGYRGPGLCEYYLRTGDQTVVPVIQQMTEELRSNMYSGGWSGRGKPAAYTYSTGSGQVHASGVNCMSFLLMAKLCGANVDDYMFKETFSQFYRFAGHGNVAYGNGIPEGGFRDNGKTSSLAFGLGAAAMISPEGEKSVFAKARDNSAMKAFYATNWFHAAHTGGGMGEIWHHAAISQVREKRPVQYRSYLDTRRWVMDLSRRFDGSIGIAGMTDRYDASATEDNMAWGTFFALTYTYPRKQLQLFGAPRSQWAKSVDLPRPWGNPADDIFHSIEPIPGGSLTMDDLLAEKIGTHDSLAVIAKFSDPALKDETLLHYIYHPEYDLRSMAMDQVTKRDRAGLVLPLLKSTDARLRQAGLLALTGMFKGSPLKATSITSEMEDEVAKMLNDPNESWWVALHAIEATARAKPAWIAKHRERLIEFLHYDCTWIQGAAVFALSKIAADSDHYKVVLPLIVDQAAAFRVESATTRSTNAIAEALKTASPAVKNFASTLMQKTFNEIPSTIKEPSTGTVMSSAAPTIRNRFGTILQTLPEGEEFVKTMPRNTLKSFVSGKESDKYTYSGKFTPNNALIGTWAWCIYPEPSKPAEVQPFIERWLNPKGGSPPGPIIANPKDTIEFLPEGKLAKSGYFKGCFWSGDMMISLHEDRAQKMEIHTIGGRDFLTIERGSFSADPTTDEEVKLPADWHSGFSVYVRQ